MEKDFDLESEYILLKKKYELPEFVKLCEDFDVERVQEKETSFLLREIRRVMNEKVAAYVNLFENLINPNAPPMFIFSILRNMSTGDKDLIKDVYKKLARVQIEVMRLDTIYSEEGEVKFVKGIFEMWQGVKKDVGKLIASFENVFDSDYTTEKGSYFG